MIKINPKKVVCIFAHPDDEAFGPGGTIAKFSETSEVHVICVTNGDAIEEFAKGNDVKTLGNVRRNELQNSTKILGVKTVTFLDFKDGELNNNNYHKVTDALTPVLEKLKPDTLVTFDQNGVSGHLDHIAVSMETTYLFERLSFVENLLYFCEKAEAKKIIGKNYFVHFPEGYSEDEVDLVMDITDYFDKKLQAMNAHVSQISDVTMFLKLFGPLLKKEYFRILQK